MTPLPAAETYSGTALTPAELAGHVRRIEIRARRLLDNAVLGEYHSVFKGHGMGFADVREYAPGDDVRTIDWNVTARLNAPFVKQYEEERELTVFLLVDVSASGVFGSTGRSKLAAATELAALLAFAASRNNDRAGLIAFSDQIEVYLPPRKSREHVLRLVHELVAIRPRGRRTDINAALSLLGAVQRRRAAVFLLSDCYAPDFQAHLRVAARRHDVMALVLSDPADLELPDAGLVRMEDAETGREVLIDTASSRVRRTYHDLAVAAQQSRDRQLAEAGVDAIEVRTDQPPIDALYRLLARRARRR